MSNGTVTRGDIVMVDVPYLDATRTVRRPALIVSDTSQMLMSKVDDHVKRALGLS
ncbi:MAG: hypothetical protein O3A00_02020 [Planctomycetota bacterium]|nr:hypothetical protein [Planctomycetota bacterium]